MDAFEINPTRLKLQSETDDGRKCFVYVMDALHWPKRHKK